MSLLDRFEAKFTRAAEQECWEWAGARHDDGYGLIWVSGKHRRAHRIAWSLFRGEIPKGLLVCHTCDNRRCVNPSHLFLGTHKDNLVDMGRKGRQRFQIDRSKARGERNNQAKLTSVQVLEIRDLLASGLTQTEIARRYSVTCSTVNKIAVGKNWGHLTEAA